MIYTALPRINTTQQRTKPLVAESFTF